MTMQNTRLLLLGLCLMMAGGCALMPHREYQRPSMELSATWRESRVSGTSVGTGEQWWQAFNDPVLNGLIEQALRTNNDLAVAAIKVRRAQLTSGLTDTNLTPSVTVGGDAGVSRNLRQGRSSNSFGVNGSVSYELDLWGRLARLREAGRWEAEATEWDRRSAAVSLIGTVATNYWQIGWLNQRITTAEASLAYGEQTLALVQERYQAGAVSGIEVAQSRQSLAGQRATLVQLRQQREAARNALAILFDGSPLGKHLSEPTMLSAVELPTVPVGIPADLLGQRPDLAAAELRLRGTLANVDATRASFYPTFSLTGSLGSSSTSLLEVLKNPVASLGAGLVLPFIQWITAKLTVAVEQTRYEEAVIGFRQTLYNALVEVDDALSSRQALAGEAAHLEEQLTQARRAEELAEVRYRAGATGVQAWLDEQEKRRKAETALAENRLSRLKHAMTLFQALGGGTKIEGKL